MKAVVITSYGGPEVLQIQEVDDPVAGDDEVLVKVAAAALNRADCSQREGSYPSPKGASPYLGLECSGTVIAVGRNVSRWEIGDQVCALLGGGGYAEKVAVPAAHCLPIPQGISLTEAASFPEVACTVWSTVFMTSRLSPGESFLMAKRIDNCPQYADTLDISLIGRVPVTRHSQAKRIHNCPQYVDTSDTSLIGQVPVSRHSQIHGGSSGIGTFAIQIARQHGVKVFVTAGSEEKLAACKKIGADVCINYKTEDFVARVKQETEGHGVDVILDNVGGPYLQKNLDSLSIDGRLFIVGFMGGVVTQVNLSCLLARRLTVQAAGLKSRTPEKKAEIVLEVEKNVWPAIEAGKVKPVVYKSIPLSEAAEAHKLMESSEHIGKILLIP